MNTKQKQEICRTWGILAFGPQTTNMTERSMRFLEEALELVQAIRMMDREQAHAMVDYVFDRPAGNIPQEIGGVGVTLFALCECLGMDFDEELHREMVRTLANTDKCRAKHAAKPAEVRADVG